MATSLRRNPFIVPFNDATSLEVGIYYLLFVIDED